MIDLSFKNVSKRYRVRQEAPEDLTRNRIVRKIQNLRRPVHDFWAVRDVSFEVQRGEALGIIGHNGAGKSTILKLLANITAPTAGEIMINGRLSALIEVGSGFHPELTGRENIYLNGSILGMRRREITEKLDSIVEFAGIREFLDTPVKRFSSGMYVRLGFSIAAHLDPDILLLDEVLAVGDAAFQAKCLKRIGELKAKGTTIVFISHDLGAVERTCDRVILMKHGEAAADGDPPEAIAAYRKRETLPISKIGTSTHETESAYITNVTARAYGSDEDENLRTGFPFEVRVSFFAAVPDRDMVFNILIYTADRVVRCQCSTDGGERITLQTGDGSLVFYSPELALLPGIYYVDASVTERGEPEPIHSYYEATVLRVEPGKAAAGEFYLPHKWKIEYFEGPQEPDSTVAELAVR